MDPTTPKIDQMSALQKATLALKKMRAKLESVENAHREPIAIVGLGCRFPGGATDPDAFWQLLRSGGDASREVPADRWDVDAFYDPTPGVPGKMYVRKGGFIDGVDRFDPLFFRISPREIITVDPQQRLLLEVVWEALEDAAIPPPTLVGTRTGVFLGISTNDYAAVLSRTAHGSNNNATAGAGNCASVASGRISYTFGFQGPCMAIDTACSSSMVAMHLAVQALRNRECNVALVAGVNLMLSPEITVNFCQGRMLSPDGRCKTFDAAADGYARGEGCGVLVLERLSDAQARGDRIVALVRGSSINQDGRSAGLTAPNGLAQEAVIRQALENAQLAPEAVDYVEAHGTGTALGDPIEMQALKAVFGPQRQRPLHVGSVKTNIGHAEAAAGVAALIKTVLMLRHQTIPQHVNFHQLNPHIDLSGIDVQIPTRTTETALHVAGVSSFGFSGTNVHVILETAPPAQVAGPQEGPPPRLFLSARSPGALGALVDRYEALFRSASPPDFRDVCHTANVGRARFPWWILVDHPDQLRSAVPANGPAPSLPPTAGRKVALPTYPFERERYWADAPAPSPETPPVTHEITALRTGSASLAAPGAGNGGHPLLGRRLPMPLSSQTRWESAIGSDSPGLEFLREHRVNHQPVMPAAAFLEMALAANPGLAIEDLQIRAPIEVSAAPARLVQTIREPDGSFSIVSCPGDGDDRSVVVHASGRAVEVSEVSSDALADRPAPGAECVPVPTDLLYEAMERRGVEHGPSFRLLSAVSRCDGFASAELLPATCPVDHPWASLHPARLDAAFQLVAAALPEDGADRFLPTRFGRVHVTRSPGSPAFVRVQAHRSGSSVTADLVIEDPQGVAVRVSGLRFEAAAAQHAPCPGLYRLSWQSRPLTEGLAPPAFFPRVEGLSAALGPESRRLAAAHDMASYAAADAELERIGTRYAVRALRDLGMSLEPGESFTFGALAESLGIAERHQRLFRRMLAMLEEDGLLLGRGRLWQVAEGAAAAARACEEPRAAAESLAARFPQMSGEIAVLGRCGEALADVLTDRTDPLSLLFSSGDAGASVFYEGSAYARTVNGLLALATGRLAGTLPAGRVMRVLEVGAGTGGATTAILEGLAGVPHAYTFTDVSMGFLHEASEKFRDGRLVGRLLDVEQDPRQQGFEPGSFDLVVAANVLHATRDLRESLTHLHDLLAPGGALFLVESTTPRRWVDLIFGLTEGWWRFQDTALRPVHPLLSRDGWSELLRSCGFDAAVDSEVIVARSREEAAAPHEARDWWIAGDDGLALGAALEAAGQRLAPRGSATQWVVMVGPAPAEPAAQEALLLGLVEQVKTALAQVVIPWLTFVASGSLGHSGLPGFVRSLAMEHPAMRPRLLIDPPGAPALVDELVGATVEPEVRWSEGDRQVIRIEPAAGNDPAGVPIAGSWLVTGGFGGLGIEVARWLSDRGASRIILLGRHVPETLPRLQAEVVAREGDAADEGLIAAIVAGTPDLRGVIHAAGTLLVTPIVELSPEAIHAVLNPKIGGALALDRAVAGRSIEHLVLFSSAAGILGSSHQSTHAFCSTFLDALARTRRRADLPALSLDWGVWSTVGAAARERFDLQAAQLGLGCITPDQGIRSFAASLGTEQAQLLVLPEVDWQRFTGNFDSGVPPIYEVVVRLATAAREDAPAAGPDQGLAGGGHGSADALARIVGSLLGLPSGFDRSVPLYDLGLDSLVAVEIKNRIEQELGIDVSVRDLIEGVSLAELAERIDGASGAAAAPRARIVPDPANRHQPFPLTDIQQAYWIGRRSDLELGDVSCYLYTEFDTRVVDVARLEEAWNILIRRHDMLRVVIQDDGTQRILETVPRYALEVCDLRNQPAERVLSELSRRRESLSRRVAEPSSWPLFDLRVTLYEDLTRVHIGFDLIAFDAASIFLVRQELGRLYDDLSAQLPPIGLSFRDFVLHQEAARSTPEWRQAEDYWKERASALPGAPELPILDPGQGGTGRARRGFHRHRVVLEPAATEELKRQAQERGLTLPSVLATAYAEVLARWSRSPHFCITVTLFNRPPLHPDIASVIGDFTSTVLLEIDARAAGFEERAAALLRQLASDLDHAAVNGTHVMREIARQQGQGLRLVPVVFTSALGFGRPAAPAAPAPESTLWDRLGTTVYNVSSTPQVWIDHQISEEDGQLFCFWDVLEDLFPPGVVDGMIAAYRSILEGLAAGDGWNRTPSDLGLRSVRDSMELVEPPELLHAAFERQAARTPDRVALVTHEGSFDYGTLHRASGHLAARLSEMLGGPAAARDRLVAVGFPKGWRQIVAVLGTLRAGAAYMPVDRALPTERRQLLIEQGEALVLDDDAWPDEALAAAKTRSPAPALPAVDDPSRLAYVIHTSGSTGVPKGVMIEHAAACTTVREVNRRFAVGPDDRVLGLSALGFDLSVYDIFGPLGVGGALVLPDPAAARDPGRWTRLLVEHKVTVWDTVPALMTMQVEYGLPADHSLRLVMLSGDWVPLELVARLRRVAPRSCLVSLGGATEAAIWSNAHEIDRVDPAWPSVPYGHPLAGHRLHVVDSRGQDCPDWVTGEIEISGLGLARGYLRDPALTAERFRVDPVTGERRYRTGDRGRFRPHAACPQQSQPPIEFLGREDSRVKIRGHRIELGEIESALVANPGVREAAVVVVGDRGAEALVAHVVPRNLAAVPGADERSEGPPSPGCPGRPKGERSGWDAVVQAAGEQARACAMGLDPEGCRALFVALDRLHVAAAGNALIELGVFAEPGERWTARQIVDRRSVHPRYLRWLARALEALAAAGLLERAGDVFSRATPLPRGDASGELARVQELDLFGFGGEEFGLLATVVESLAAILTERFHSASIYTASETPGIYEKLFRFSEPVVREATLAAIRSRPGARILEVGGGLGSTARQVLPAIAGLGASYHFTDISAHFLKRAQARFAGEASFTTGLLDIEKPIEPQGLPAGSFDVVIATSVLHATADVEAALRNVRDLLAPGGLLVLVEETRFFPWFDLSMGLQQGFDRFTDTGWRSRHPLVSRELWPQLLEKTGFARRQFLASPGSAADHLGFDVFVAQAGSCGESVDAGSLTRYLRERLPDHMVPASIVVRPAMPLMPSGKVDRRALVAAGGADSRPGAFVAPRTETEKGVAAIWADVLGVGGIGLTDSFFDLGGTSLSLIRVHRMMRERFSCDASVNDLFRNPTVDGFSRALARASRTGARATSPAIVPIQTGGARVPLFAVPGIIMVPYYLTELSQALGDDQPFHGFHAPGPGYGEPLESVEELARLFVAAMRGVQPQGPYRLLGHSYGGTVAFEMARQLTAAGASVQALIMIDTVVLEAATATWDDDEVLQDSMVKAFYAIHGRQLGRSYESLLELPPAERYRWIMDRIQTLSLGPAYLQVESILAQFRAHLRAASRYTPGVWSGNVTLLRTEGGYPQEMMAYISPRAVADAALGWTEHVAAPIDTQPIPGDHMTLTDPAHVPVLAGRIRTALDRAMHAAPAGIR